jgi:hypothetical protein
MEVARFSRSGDPAQVICWDRGRPARKRAEGAKSLQRVRIVVFALRAHCGRDARGPSKSLETGHRTPDKSRKSFNEAKHPQTSAC